MIDIVYIDWNSKWTPKKFEWTLKANTFKKKRFYVNTNCESKHTIFFFKDGDEMMLSSDHSTKSSNFKSILVDQNTLTFFARLILSYFEYHFAPLSKKK